MFNWDNFERSVFTLEDQKAIEDIVNLGEVGRVCQVVMVDTPVKEYWINKIVKAYAPPAPAELKDFSEELRQATEAGQEMTPELEAQFQAKLNAENDLKRKEAELLHAKEEEALQQTVEVFIEKEQVKEEVKRRGRKAKQEIINEA